MDEETQVPIDQSNILSVPWTYVLKKKNYEKQIYPFLDMTENFNSGLDSFRS